MTLLYWLNQPSNINLQRNNKALFGRKPSPPFDGSDDKVSVATSENQVVLYIKEGQQLSLSVIGEFSKLPYALSDTIDLIEKPSSH